MAHVQFYQNRPVQAGELPLVLLHGFCEDSTLWQPLLPFLKKTPHVRVDLLGFGGSALPENPDMAAQAASVNSVLEKLGIARAVLVGHSMGGYVALEFAAKWPLKLAGLGLFHAHPYPDSAERFAIRRRALELVNSGKKDLYVAQLFPGLFPAAFAAAHPEILEKLVRRGQTFSPQAISAAIQAMMTRRDHRATLAAVPCFVQFILGEKDALVPLEGMGEMLALPALADVHLYKGVGHMAMFEATARAGRAVFDFWKLCQIQNSKPGT